MDTQQLRRELHTLTNLRNAVIEKQDVLPRLFKPDTNGPTMADLDKAVAELESKVPGFYVWFSASERVYALCPYPEQA